MFLLVCCTLAEAIKPNKRKSFVWQMWVIIEHCIQQIGYQNIYDKLGLICVWDYPCYCAPLGCNKIGRTKTSFQMFFGSGLSHSLGQWDTPKNHQINLTFLKVTSKHLLSSPKYKGFSKFLKGQNLERAVNFVPL